MGSLQAVYRHHTVGYRYLIDWLHALMDRLQVLTGGHFMDCLQAFREQVTCNLQAPYW